MISVLLPSRGRPDSLIDSVIRLHLLASGSIEVLIAADNDDEQTQTAARTLDADALRVTERRGYARLHEYFNDLAAEASGDWLLLWNDDAEMLTDHWDRLIEELPPEVLVADLQSQHSPLLCCFPAVRHEAVEAVGGFSPHTCHADSYWQQLGGDTGTIRPIEVQVNHRRFDLTGDHDDQTYAEGQAAYQLGSYHSDKVQAAIAADAKKLQELVNGVKA